MRFRAFLRKPHSVAIILAVSGVFLGTAIEALIPNAQQASNSIPTNLFSFVSHDVIAAIYSSFFIGIFVTVLTLCWLFARRESDAIGKAIGTLGIGIWALSGWIVLTAKWGVLPYSIAPSPYHVLVAFNSPFQNSILWHELWVRALRTSFSLLIAMTIAVPSAIVFGIVLGRAKRFSEYIIPYVHMLAPLPPIVLYPLIKLAFYPVTIRNILGLKELPQGLFDLLSPMMIVCLGIWAAFWPIFSAAFDGARRVRLRLVRVAELAGASKSSVLLRVILPQSVSQIFANAPISLVMAVIVVLFAEAQEEPRPKAELLNTLFGTRLGSLLVQVSTESEMAQVLATVAAILLVVAVFLQTLRFLRWLVMPWARVRKIAKKQHSPKTLGSASNTDNVFANPDALPALSAFYSTFDERLGLEDNLKNPAIKLNNFKAEFQNFRLRIDELEISHASVVSIIGKSGSGKSTLIETLSGFRSPISVDGSIFVNGFSLYSPKGDIQIHPSDLNISIVYQDYGLFPHMTVRENIAFSLRSRLGFLAKAKKVPKETARDLLELAYAARPHFFRFLSLSDDLLERYPHQLSGGQAQRVAVARALLTHPSILILDEGLSSIDQPTRGDIRNGIRELAKALRTTVISVSHDNQDVLRMSDRIVYMATDETRTEGRVIANAAPEEFYYRPGSAEAARFIGHKNVFGAKLSTGGAIEIFELSRHDRTAKLNMPSGMITGFDGSKILLIPSTWINPPVAGDELVTRGRIVKNAFLGGQHELTIQLDNEVKIEAVIQDDDLRAFLEKLGSNEKEFPFVIARAPNVIGV